jgi:hypothetical protein
MMSIIFIVNEMLIVPSNRDSLIGIVIWIHIILIISKKMTQLTYLASLGSIQFLYLPSNEFFLMVICEDELLSVF